MPYTLKTYTLNVRACAVGLWDALLTWQGDSAKTA